MGIVTAPERLTKEGHLNGKWKMDVEILTDFVSITVKPQANRERKAQKVHLRQNQRGI